MYQKNKIYFQNKRIFSEQDHPGFVLHVAGENNEIFLNPFKENGCVKLTVSASNNHFEFGINNFVVHNLNVLITDAPKCKTENIFVKIGNNNRFQGNVTILSPTGSDSAVKLSIGNYNLFAEGVFFHGRQDHLVYDIKSKKRINHEASIILDDNIWIGSLVHFLPKTHIHKNCVIGMNSLCNKDYKKENVLLVGSPAEIKKENIAWNIYLDDSYLSMTNPM